MPKPHRKQTIPTPTGTAAVEVAVEVAVAVAVVCAPTLLVLAAVAYLPGTHVTHSFDTTV
jgi:hypothetical protein